MIGRSEILEIVVTTVWILRAMSWTCPYPTTDCSGCALGGRTEVASKSRGCFGPHFSERSPPCCAWQVGQGIREGERPGASLGRGGGTASQQECRSNFAARPDL